MTRGGDGPVAGPRSPCGLPLRGLGDRHLLRSQVTPAHHEDGHEHTVSAIPAPAQKAFTKPSVTATEGGCRTGSAGSKVCGCVRERVVEGAQRVRPSDLEVEWWQTRSSLTATLTRLLERSQRS